MSELPFTRVALSRDEKRTLLRITHKNSAEVFAALNQHLNMSGWSLTLNEMEEDANAE